MTCNHPPPQKQRRNPNKSAEQISGPIFSEKKFPVPWISVLGPNTPSFWLLCSWSHVETQNISQFPEKNYHLSDRQSKSAKFRNPTNRQNKSAMSAEVGCRWGGRGELDSVPTTPSSSKGAYDPLCVSPGL